jgi:hypothetical protein
MPFSMWMEARCTAFLNLSGIVVADRRALRVEERALAVALEDGAEVPAVAVVVGELGVLELRVESRDVLQKLDVAPLAADGRALGIAVEDLARSPQRSGTSASPATCAARRTRSPT